MPGFDEDAYLGPASTHRPSLEEFAWLLGRAPRPDDFSLQAARSTGEATDDSTLVERVMVSYVGAAAEFTPSRSFWDSHFFELNRSVHDSLVSGDTAKAVAVLRNPADNTHFWGFDAIAKAPEGQVEPHELVIRRLNSKVEWTALYALWIMDSLKNLAEAVGAKRVAYPEVDVAVDSVEQRQNIEETLISIEKSIGVRLVFPNPYSGEWGLRTTRGILGFRSVQAVYQAWRIRELAGGQSDFKVIEIGAGLGRTAYFANLLGIKNYTIIDIPLTNAAQAYFLGRTVGERMLQLHGETNDGRLRVLPPNSRALTEEYDLVVNVDSLTEMDNEVALGYWNFIKHHTPTLLSINHEFNSLTVRSLYQKESGLRTMRYPYWMRRGYVEELVQFIGAQ
ncbi:MAG: putative sugar O-methyltransferase [Alcaligenaceae bacterium]|nr:MAG: putative sugar O-methyltransferase [Alcaligenaceae bacterium]